MPILFLARQGVHFASTAVNRSVRKALPSFNYICTSSISQLTRLTLCDQGDNRPNLHLMRLGQLSVVGVVPSVGMSSHYLLFGLQFVVNRDGLIRRRTWRIAIDITERGENIIR